MGKMNNFDTVVSKLTKDGLLRVPERIYFKTDNAKETLQSAMSYFIDNAVQWLPEYNKIAEWLTDNQGKGLFCIGNCGRGKSLICTLALPCILNAVHGKIVHVMTAQELNANLNTALTRAIVCIDDIGAEGIANSYGNKIIAVPEMFDNAERTGKLIVATSNLGYNDLKEKYGERTIERIISTCKVVQFNGKSLRK